MMSSLRRHDADRVSRSRRRQTRSPTGCRLLVREGEAACLATDAERRHVVSVPVAHVEEHTRRVQGKNRADSHGLPDMQQEAAAKLGALLAGANGLLTVC